MPSRRWLHVPSLQLRGFRVVSDVSDGGFGRRRFREVSLATPLAGGGPRDRSWASLGCVVLGTEWLVQQRTNRAGSADGAKRLHHPLVGDLTLDFEALELPGDEGQRLNIYTAAPHTPAAWGRRSTR